eukprot:3671644-Prymnesium_polylepis.1
MGLVWLTVAKVETWDRCAEQLSVDHIKGEDARKRSCDLCEFVRKVDASKREQEGAVDLQKADHNFEAFLQALLHFLKSFLQYRHDLAVPVQVIAGRPAGGHQDSIGEHRLFEGYAGSLILFGGRVASKPLHVAQKLLDTNLPRLPIIPFSVLRNDVGLEYDKPRPNTDVSMSAQKRGIHQMNDQILRGMSCGYLDHPKGSLCSDYWRAPECAVVLTELDAKQAGVLAVREMLHGICLGNYRRQRVVLLDR